jgi:hypothetical protein
MPQAAGAEMIILVLQQPVDRLMLEDKELLAQILLQQDR